MASMTADGYLSALESMPGGARVGDTVGLRRGERVIDAQLTVSKGTANLWLSSRRTDGGLSAGPDRIDRINLRAELGIDRLGKRLRIARALYEQVEVGTPWRIVLGRGALGWEWIRSLETLR